MNFFCSSPKRSAICWPAGLPHRQRRCVGHVDLLDTGRRGRALEGPRPGPVAVLHEPVAVPTGPLLLTGRTTAWTGAGPAADRCRQQASDPASRCSSTTVANVNRTVGTMLGHEVTKGVPGAGPAGRHHRHHARPGPAGQLRAFLPARHHAAADRRRQRLRRQGGLSGGRHRGASRRPVRRPGQHHRRQRDRLRRHQRPGVHLRGVVGERFCVRNSGATAVVEASATTAAST